ncbi:hypothetical protein [Streptomyces sp. GS7]|uniref:hypothetical protein n=1 Tax=Streptomyces sp. GS7 TaxID=2692234 RepID=UPI001315E17C|nr:hypothetical protein [Streptomyces sp. GS7]QHC24908.1 hypothetical protein GR130_29605 [Streptomyces sp. GS7]
MPQHPMTGARRSRTPGRHARAAFALVLADGRRKLNLLQGRATPQWAQIATAVCFVLGAAAALALAVGAGLLAAHTLPVTSADLGGLARYAWLPAVLVVASMIAGVRPNEIRLVVDPPDREVLLSLPITPGDLLFVRAVGPALLAAGGVAVTACAFLTTWLSGSPAGSQLLPAALTLVAGLLLVSLALRLALTGLLALARDGAARLRTLLLAAGGGVAVGIAIAPFTEGMRAQGPLAQALPRLAGQALNAVRPGWWDAMVGGGAYRIAAVAAATALPPAAVALILLRRAALTRVLRVGGAPPAAMLRTGRAARGTHRWDRLHQRSVLMVFLAKDLRAALRGPAAATLGLRRCLLGGIALLGTGAGHALGTGGGSPLAIPTATAVGALVGGVLLVADEAVQVAGVEAERKAWNALLQSPLSTGQLKSCKAVSFAVVVAGCVAPGAVGWALLTGGTGPDLVPLLLTAPAAACAVGAAAVATSTVMPPAEHSGQGRITRSPAAGVLQATLTGAVMLPTVALIPLLPGGEPLLRALPPLVTCLALLSAAAVLLARSPSSRYPSAPPVDRKAAPR